jgi:chromosome segregation ATPase
MKDMGGWPFSVLAQKQFGQDGPSTSLRKGWNAQDGVEDEALLSRMIEKGITMERRREPEARRLITVVILFCALVIPLFAIAGCGEQLARMEENQVRQQALIAANARELATISAQLHTGQGKINESIQDLDGDTQQVASNVATVQNQQQQLQSTVAAGNEGLNRRIGSVEDNTRTLQGSVAQVSGVTQRTAADVTALGQQHTALHQMVQANQQQLTGSLGAVANNQQRIQTGIGDLRHANDGLADRLTSMAAKHDTMYATLQSNDKLMAERLAALASSDRQICNDIANVHTFLRTVATNLAAANSALKEQLGTSHDSLTTQVAALASSQQQLRAGVDALGGKADQAAAQIVDTKSALQETLKVSREVLTGQMAASLQHQQTLQTDVRGVSDKADKLTAQQQSLYEAVKTNHDVVVTKLAEVSDTQTKLQAGVSSLGDRTSQTAADLKNSIAGQQASLQQIINAGHAVLTARATELAASQQALKTDIDTLGQATQRVASDIAGMAAGQDTLGQILKAHSDKVNEQVVTLTNAQKEMKANLDTLTATAGQTALDVHALSDNQTKLTQTVKAGVADLGARTDKVAAGQNSLNDTLNRQGQAVSGQVAKVADGQQQVQGRLDTLTAMTGQASLDVLAVDNHQKELAQAVKAGVADLGTRTDKAAAGLTAVAAGQNSLNESLNRQGQAVSGQVAKIADGQQQMQSNLDTLTATTGQTALDVLAITTRQDAVRTALQSHDEASHTQMTKLANDQQQMQGSLDTVTAVAGQASLDAMAMNNNQGQLGQAVQAGRQEMAGRLTILAQEQQNWSGRLDAAQAKVATIAQSIAALEQQIAKLQEAVQTSLQGTTTALGATSQQRQQFEGKVSQDIQAVIDSLTQLRQTQTSLQEQIAQVQKCTQGQADSIRTVLDRMKATPTMNNRATEQAPAMENPTGASEPKQSGAEFRISAAAEKPPVATMPEAAK